MEDGGLRTEDGRLKAGNWKIPFSFLIPHSSFLPSARSPLDILIPWGMLIL
jgi:hypothetical protein